MGGALHVGRHPARRGDLSGKVIKINGISYRFHGYLGTGTYGTVYSAQNRKGRNVAVKVIDIARVSGIRAALVQSYRREVAYLKRLRQESGHVVHIFYVNFNSRSGRAYIVMELGDINLADYLKSSRASRNNSNRPAIYVEPTVRKAIWSQLVAIVATLTRNGIVSQKKTANVLSFADVGTPQFRAPELSEGHSGGQYYFSPKADIWSLGAILYYMTYGQPPQSRQRPTHPPKEQPSTRDRALQDILRRTLALNPHNRTDIFTVLRYPYTNNKK